MEQITPVDLIQQATGVYNFECLIGAEHGEAVRHAIQSVLELHRAQVVSELSDHVNDYASVLSAEDDVSGEVVDYVEYVSKLIRSFAAPEAEISTYEPTSGDLIQVIVTGAVARDSARPEWSLELGRGDVLEFDIGIPEPGVRVRLIEREEPV